MRGFQWRHRLLSSTVVVWRPACQLGFLTVFLCRVFLPRVGVWRRLAQVCRHTFYIVVYLFIFRYRA